MRIEIEIPDELHKETAELVAMFAGAMADKLKIAQDKYGYSDGWKDSHWRYECANKLVEHIQKGDPRDVANYCAFMWYHSWQTSLRVLA
jgi:hypothetical protein